MSNLAICRELYGEIEKVVLTVSASLQEVGFGILTRIDFDKKIKEKVGETIPRCVILGACNPHLAHQAYLQSSDAALLIPCNVVLTEISKGKVRIEVMRPTKMLEFIPQIRLLKQIQGIEKQLETIIYELNV